MDNQKLKINKELSGSKRRSRLNLGIVTLSIPVVLLGRMTV